MPANRVIYLDHAATTPLEPRAFEAMMPYLTTAYGNPSATYSVAKEAADGLARARKAVATVLGARPTEIVFTSSGTDSINTAIKGVAFQQKKARAGNHIVTSQIEHHAVLHACQYLERFGFEVTYLPVDRFGVVDPTDVARAVGPLTALVSIMAANNEIGTIEPIADISAAVRERAAELKKRIPLHTDAVQAPNAIRLDTVTPHVELMSLSAHKFRGPKGVGILYIKRGVPFLAQQNGGGQERQRRAGTEDVAGIVGTAEALRLTQVSLEQESERIGRLARRLHERAKQAIPRTNLNGPSEQRLTNNLSLSFDGADARDLLEDLDRAGIMVSAGAACNATTIEPSHVLIACGLELETAAATVRFTLGRETTDADIDETLRVLPSIVARSRSKRAAGAAAG